MYTGRELKIFKLASTKFSLRYQLQLLHNVFPSFSAGGIPVYVYKPLSMPKDPAIYVYFHGGGNVVGTRDNVDSMCKIIAR